MLTWFWFHEQVKQSRSFLRLGDKEVILFSKWQENKQRLQRFLKTFLCLRILRFSITLAIDELVIYQFNSVSMLLIIINKLHSVSFQEFNNTLSPLSENFCFQIAVMMLSGWADAQRRRQMRCLML